MNKDIYLSIKYSTKKVNLCYKELAIQICVRSTNEQGQNSFDYVSYKKAAELIAKNEVNVYESSDTKTCLAKASSALLGSISFGHQVKVQNIVKQAQINKGEELNWFEKIEIYMKESSNGAWPKSGLKI